MPTESDITVCLHKEPIHWFCSPWVFIAYYLLGTVSFQGTLVISSDKIFALIELRIEQIAFIVCGLVLRYNNNWKEYLI